MSARRGRIFGVGLSKTGTTSLHRAAQMLGLRSVHYPDAARMLAGDWSVLDGVDIASDIPVALGFRELDAAFPGSRFVLTVRDEGAWLASMRANFDPVPAKYAGTPELEVFRRTYGGADRYDERTMRRVYREHERAVRTHFVQRPEDLLVLDICAGDGWETLCAFLGLRPPPEPFPHVNASPTRAGAA